MTDRFGRAIDYLRVSVTDRCNLRCSYCMPPEGMPWTPHNEILTYEQMVRLCRVFASLGVKKIKLTGGEPLVRQGLPHLIEALKGIEGIEWISLTTNGLLLDAQLDALLAAGLDGVNISLDAIDETCYRAITRGEGADIVLRGLDRALAVPGLTVKLNCVPNGANDSELVPLAALAKDRPLAVRFIELMPLGAAKGLTPRTQAEVQARLEAAFGALTPCAPPPGSGPCRYFKAAGFIGTIGFISAVSHQFCDCCNRVRLTSTGYFKTCLQFDAGADLRRLLIGGADDAQLAEEIRRAIDHKPQSHQFAAETIDGGEQKNMSQIGG